MPEAKDRLQLWEKAFGNNIDLLSKVVKDNKLDNQHFDDFGNAFVFNHAAAEVVSGGPSVS